MMILGITGSIAAIKSLELLRLLQAEGLRVVVVLTEDAERFLSPLVVRSFAHGPVYTSRDLFKAAPRL